MTRMKWLCFLLLIIVLAGCKSTNTPPPTGSSGYVLLAWNDLGMHCLNPTYDTAVILPPYNTLWAQLIEKGNPPRVVATGFTVEYRIIGNTYSYGKRSFGQFWDNCPLLFGLALPQNLGLNLVEAALHNGLAGSMVAKGDHFVVDGIPLTPVLDDGTWNPYQNAEFVARDAGGVEIARTRTTAPTSDEITCSRCHGNNAFLDVLQKHDEENGTSLRAQRPVLCARCHGSPVLGTSGPGSSGKYLSRAIHGFHANEGATCYDCHPGAVTQCSRSLKHTRADGNCQACHGTMAQVAQTVASGGRVPWLNEPKCATCHAGISGVDTGDTLYRNATGHGGLYCAVCHSSPHAMIPSREATDNYQAITLQGKAKTIGSCAACHSSSRGEGATGEFAGTHGGSNPAKKNACHICHTAIPTDTARWPHAFGWKNRSQ
jgi:hypothetical protein